MDIAAVLDEVGVALKTITGLRVFDYPAGKITPPAAIVALPDDITYDTTYGRGADTFVVPVIVVVGKNSDRVSRNKILAYVAGSGAESVKAAVDGGLYTEGCSVTVSSASFDTIPIAAVEYLAVVFDVEVVGPGA